MIGKPTDSEMIALIGAERLEVWKDFCVSIENKYDMNVAWNSGGKAW